MSRTVSARIPKEWHEELRDRCNQIGCTVNDFLCGAIELALKGSTKQDFGDEEDNKKSDSFMNQKPQEKHEGKIPPPHFHFEGNKPVQDEATWENSPQTDQNKHKVSELKNVRIFERYN